MVRKVIFGTALGKRQNARETQAISMFYMLSVRKTKSSGATQKLQSRMEFCRFRAKVSPLAIYIYIYLSLSLYVYIYIYTYVYV